MAHPSPSDWKRHESVLKAGIKGFNVLKELPRLLKKEYSWLNEYLLGFYIDDDVPDRRSLGWEHLRREHFDIENFNTAIGLGHGLTDDGAGNLKYRDNYIMIMPKWFRKEMLDLRHEASEEKMARQINSQAYIPPGTKQEDIEECFSEVEERRLRVEPKEQAEKPKPKRGRPKKT